jgi:Tol biopolymer transport system component
LDLYLAQADGSGEAVSVAATEEWDEFATDWCSDGNYILYDRNGADGRNDVWYLERKGDEWTPVPFLESRFDQRAARFSPDGKHVAYVSNKSADHEVYVTDFPQGRRVWKASEGGGVRPVWSKNGAELYYVDARAVLHSVAVARDPELLLGQPTRLFQASGLDGTYVPNHDVSSDGHFLVREPSSDNPVTIRVMQNWFEEFREK